MNMNEQEIREKVKKIVVEDLGVDESEVTDSARLYEDLGADSIDYVEILMKVEKEFGITIPDDEAFCNEKSLNIIGNIIEYVRERLA